MECKGIVYILCTLGKYKCYRKSGSRQVTVLVRYSGFLIRDYGITHYISLGLVKEYMYNVLWLSLDICSMNSYGSPIYPSSIPSWAPVRLLG